MSSELDSRFGELAMKRGHTAIPNTFLLHADAFGLTPHEIMVLLAILSAIGRGATTATISIRNLSLRSANSTTTVKKSIDRLEGLGLIEVASGTNENGNTSNSYSINGFVEACALIGRNIDEGATRYLDQRHGLDRLLESLSESGELRQLQRKHQIRREPAS